MQSKPATALWMGGAFVGALALACSVLVGLGMGEKGTNAALAMTARLSFLLFWLAYTGGPLVALFGRLFEPVRQRTRDLGLAFASAHLVHLGLVAWLCWIGAVPAVRTFVVFGIAVGWMYLIALVSIARLRQAVHPGIWWLSRVVGLNYIAFVFALDFLRHPLDGGIKHVLGYLPFAVLCIAGPILRLIAWIARNRRERFRSSAPLPSR